jgi:hypothetical protein
VTEVATDSSNHQSAGHKVSEQWEREGEGEDQRGLWAPGGCPSPRSKEGRGHSQPWPSPSETWKLYEVDGDSQTASIGQELPLCKQPAQPVRGDPPYTVHQRTSSAGARPPEAPPWDSEHGNCDPSQVTHVCWAAPPKPGAGAEISSWNLKVSKVGCGSPDRPGS